MFTGEVLRTGRTAARWKGPFAAITVTMTSPRGEAFRRNVIEVVQAMA